MGWLEMEWSEGLTHEAGRSDVGLASGNIESSLPHRVTREGPSAALEVRASI